MKRAVVIFADGFEEIETIAPIDILRRANIDVLTVGLRGNQVTGAHGIIVHADTVFSSFTFTNEEAIILPGGGQCAQSLSESQPLAKLLQHAHSQKTLVAAICASAALVLGKSANLLAESSFTCYPGFEKQVSQGKHKAGVPVVVDKNIITGQGPGVAIPFALEIVSYLCGSEERKNLETAMCCV